MAVLERRLREKEARRQQILDAARDLFFERGFEGTTIDEIAQRTEISKGAFYLHFPSKEEIYITLMQEGSHILHGMMEKAAHGQVPADTLLRRIGLAYFEFYQRYPGYFRMLFLYQSSPAVHAKISPELASRCENDAREALMLVASVIEKGIQEELFKPCASYDIAVMTWSCMNGIILMGERGDYRELRLDTTMERIHDLFMESTVAALKAGR
jgi:AcrR family transcriptional regulator